MIFYDLNQDRDNRARYSLPGLESEAHKKALEASEEALDESATIGHEKTHKLALQAYNHVKRGRYVEAIKSHRKAAELHDKVSFRLYDKHHGGEWEGVANPKHHAGLDKGYAHGMAAGIHEYAAHEIAKHTGMGS
jgi:hypothetical protein